MALDPAEPVGDSVLVGGERRIKTKNEEPSLQLVTSVWAVVSLCTAKPELLLVSRKREVPALSPLQLTPSSAACLITKPRNTHFHYSRFLRTGKLFLFLQTFYFLFSAVLLFFFLSLTSRCRAPNASIRACTHNEPANKKRRERQWQRLISQFRIDAVSCTLALSLSIYSLFSCFFLLLTSLVLPSTTTKYNELDNCSTREYHCNRCTGRKKIERQRVLRIDSQCWMHLISRLV